MFPGADAADEDASYVVIGAPLDVSTTFEPGARFGPRRVRHYARPFDDYHRDTSLHFSDLGVGDHGDVGPTDDVAEYLDFLRAAVAEYDEADAVPVLVGGEHTVSLAAVRALEPAVFVALDAHLDLHESYAGNRLNHATVTRRALEVADRAVLLGARTGSEAEWDRAAGADVTVVGPDEVGEWTPALEGERVYLSLDVDVADPAYAPGTGTKEPFGLAPTTIRDVVRTLAPGAVGFDVVEVNDRDDGQAAVLAAKLLREFVFAHAAGE